MAEALVSIVLPTYNGSRYLRQSIESILAQTYSHWELIIVDDCSTDATPSIIQEYVAKDNRIRSIRHTVNRKLPAALNTGFADSQGEYLTWTSDDNLYRAHAITELIGYLQQHPKTDFVYSDFSIIDEQGQEVKYYTVMEPGSLLLRSCFGPSFMFRRAVYHRIGNYNETLFLVEDYDYWMRIACYFKIDAYHQNLYEYRTHSQSLTMTRTKQVMLKIEQVQLAQWSKFTHLSYWQKSRLYAWLLRKTLERRDIGHFIQYTLRAWQYLPAIVVSKFGLRRLPPKNSGAN